MRSFRISTVAVILGLLAGCAGTDGTATSTASSWDGMASDVVSEVKSLAGSRPVYVASRDASMPFADAYRAQLISQFSEAGVAVANAPDGALVVSFDVSPVAHPDKPEAVVTTQVHDGARLLVSRSVAHDLDPAELVNFSARSPAPVAPAPARLNEPLPVKQFAVVGDGAPNDAEVADRVYRRMLRK